jgi:hypothetical protein
MAIILIAIIMIGIHATGLRFIFLFSLGNIFIYYVKILIVDLH